MSDRANSEDRVESETFGKTVCDFRKNIVTMYVKQMEKCIEQQQESNDIHSEMCERADSDDSDVKEADDVTTTANEIPASPTQKSQNNDEPHRSVNCVKNNSTGNDEKTGDEGHVSPVRVSTTSFSVSDILDPKKFTGSNGSSKQINTAHIQPWLSRKRRHTDDMDSDEERLEGHGQYCSSNKDCDTISYP